MALARIFLVLIVVWAWLAFGSWRAAGQTPDELLDDIRAHAAEIDRLADELEAAIAPPVPPVNTPPVAAIGASCAWLDCDFLNLSTDADGDTLASAWLVNGLTSTETDVSVTFAAAGTYDVQLTVDDGGANDTASIKQTVTAEPPPIPPGESALSDCVAAMTPGDWNTCGTNKIPLLSKAQVASLANQLTNGFNGSGPRGVIELWNGGLLCGAGMCFWGGGHKGYAGNDWYRLDFDSLKWERSADQGIGPSPADKGPSGNANPLLYPSSINGFSAKIQPGRVFDARVAGPAAVHTYGGIEATPDGRRCFIGGKRTTISGESAGGDPRFIDDDNLWCFDPRAITWAYHGAVPAGQWQVTTRMMLDPVSGRMIAMGDKQGGTFDPANIVTSGGRLVWDHAASFANTSEGDAAIAVLSDGRRVVVSMQKAKFRYWAVADHADGSISITETGSSSHSLHKESGLAWHPGLQRMIIWPGHGAVYALDVVSKQLSQFPAASGTTPSAPMNGVHTKWRYYEPLDVFVGYANYNQPAWFYRLPGSALPPVEPPPIEPPPSGGSAGRPAGLPLPGNAALFECSDQATSALPSCPDLQALVNAAAAGDTITLKPGRYFSCANVTKADLTIDFQGSDISGLCASKATIIQNAPNLTLLNMACDAPGNHGGNDSCLRRQANGLVLDNVYFRDGDEGILGDISLDGDVTITNSLFENMGGSNGRSHLVYMAGIDNLFIGHSEFRCPVEGHALKIGARNTIINNSIIDSTRCVQAGNSAPSSREIDNFAGGGLTLRNNVVTKYAGSDNFDMIGYAPGGQYDSSLQPRFVTLEDNTFNCLRSPTTVLAVGNGNPVVELSGNTFNAGCAVQ